MNYNNKKTWLDENYPASEPDEERLTESARNAVELFCKKVMDVLEKNESTHNSRELVYGTIDDDNIVSYTSGTIRELFSDLGIKSEELIEQPDSYRGHTEENLVFEFEAGVDYRVFSRSDCEKWDDEGTGIDKIIVYASNDLEDAKRWITAHTEKENPMEGDYSKDFSMIFIHGKWEKIREAKPERLMKNFELAAWLRGGIIQPFGPEFREWAYVDERDEEADYTIRNTFQYMKSTANDEVDKDIRIRVNYGEWQVPTVRG